MPSVTHTKDNAFTGKMWDGMCPYNKLMLTKLSQETSTKKLLFVEKKDGVES